MSKIRTFGAAIAVMALAGAPAYAQNNNPTNGSATGANNNAGVNTSVGNNAANNSAMGANTTTTANNNGNNNNNLNGTLQMNHDGWRSSKLVGANVYGQNNQQIGTVNDLLLNSSGQVAQAILSVGGGFLGIGSKLVAVPWSELKFEPSTGNNNVVAGNSNGGNNAVATNGASGAGVNGTAGNGTVGVGTFGSGNGAGNNNAGANNAVAVNGNAAGGTVGATNGAAVGNAGGNNGAVGNNNQPEFSIVLPTANKDTVNAMPTFNWNNNGNNNG